MTIQLSSRDSEFLKKPEPVNQLPRHVPPSGFYRSFVKPVVDWGLTLLALPFILVVVVVAAILIARDGHNPFYSQLRVGRKGQVFRMWKLRTMVHDADERLKAHLEADPAARCEWEQQQKLRNDPRVTKIGRILRKTSMDELPQFWNVLTGEMSLVGPRPMMVSQRKHYSGQSYYNLRPGLTGLWQVSDRNNCEFSGRVYYDDLYERSVSMRTDIKVLVRTVGVVLRGTGC